MLAGVKRTLRMLESGARHKLRTKPFNCFIRRFYTEKGYIG